MVQSLWHLCDILRDDGVTYHQYINELTYLLFLKMAEEASAESGLPIGYRWRDLQKQCGEARFRFYHELLLELGNAKSDIIKCIYAHPTSLIRHPENLDALVDSIESLDWHSVHQEALGDIYEGLLEKTSKEASRGAGQYFTPRPLVEAIVSVIRPQFYETIQDPAAGTGGFLVVADRFRRKAIGKQSRRNPGQAYGVELNPDTYRLLCMNTHLHGIDGKYFLEDTLAVFGSELPNADVILTNPPFGVGRGGRQARRSDLSFSTSNKQLAFLQHIYMNLANDGRAAVVVPDNVLFEEGLGAEVRADLMKRCNLHTILRLPKGLFYATGINTNVLFFTKGIPTKSIWIYDARSNVASFTRSSNPLTLTFFEEFIKCYGNNPAGKSRRTTQSSPLKTGFSGGGRWRKFDIAEIRDNNYRLDSLTWLRNKSLKSSSDLPEPEELATDAISELTAAIIGLQEIVMVLEKDNGTNTG